MTSDKRTETVFTYHARTKHHPQRFARSLGYLDWANQPDPFRRYAGAELLSLPLAEDDASPLYESVMGALPHSQPLSLETIGLLFEHALAISAWKEFEGTRWALRCNPSSGNLHPTEGYLVAPAIEGLRDGAAVYHYAPRAHGLEVRRSLSPDEWKRLVEGFPEGTFFVGLSSIVWREAWKYGERAYRYCQHDVGHGIAAVALSAAALGWRTRHVEALGDDDVVRLLGLGQGDPEEAEREEPDALLAVMPGTGAMPEGAVLPGLDGMGSGPWLGAANVLSSDRVDWPIIDAVSQATEKGRTRGEHFSTDEFPVACEPHGSSLTFNTIARQRRSAVDMDGVTGMARETFYTMLARTMPGGVSFGALGAPHFVHLAVFVHRVEGLAPGLYVLLRETESGARFRAGCKPAFDWTTPEGCPDGLPLFHLASEDCRNLAANVSCGQTIAGHSAFSLGMIAEFREPIEAHGAWWYRRLFWETGVVGQVLYLEAEAAGLRSTGIGCFFDDLMHQVLGIEGDGFQSLYHFTVGGPVEDGRLTTLPPYGERRPD